MEQREQALVRLKDSLERWGLNPGWAEPLWAIWVDNPAFLAGFLQGLGSKRTFAVAKDSLGAPGKTAEDLLRAQGAYTEAARLVRLADDLVEALRGPEEVA